MMSKRAYAICVSLMVKSHTKHIYVAYGITSIGKFYNEKQQQIYEDKKIGNNNLCRKYWKLNATEQ